MKSGQLAVGSGQLSGGVIRLWRPEHDAEDDDPVGPITPDTRLSRFFWQAFVPGYCQSPGSELDPKTVAYFATAVRKFGRHCGNLPLREITLPVCRQFVREDLKQGGGRRAEGGVISLRTVRNHTKALEAIFRFAAAPSAGQKETAVNVCPLIDDPRWADGLWVDARDRPRPAPWFPDIKTDPIAMKQPLSAAELRAWLAACEVAQQPLLEECSPAEWWQALIVFLYYTALRIGCVLRLRRSMVRSDAGLPGLALTWIEIPGGQAGIGKKKKPLLKWLPEPAVASIDALPTKDAIFPWLDVHTEKHLHATRRKILRAAGFSEARIQQVGFHLIRATSASELFPFDPRAAQQQLDHESLRTTIEHYVGAPARVRAQAAMLAPAVASMPRVAAISAQRIEQ